MAAKMAEMRRVAEMEAEEESDDESESAASKALGSSLPKPSLPLQVDSESNKDGAQLNGGGTRPGPKLKFASTRNMGPSRDRMNIGNTMNVLRGYRRAGGGGGAVGSCPDIFDELDKGLEWCQGQCEHAAHQFLRDGECSTEIENIKKRLEEVREIAEKKIKKLKIEEEVEKKMEASKPEPSESSHFNGMKPTPVSNSIQDGPPGLEVDDKMEVDDDDDDDDNDDFDPKKFVFKRSGDVAY